MFFGYLLIGITLTIISADSRIVRSEVDMVGETVDRNNNEYFTKEIIDNPRSRLERVQKSFDLIRSDELGYIHSSLTPFIRNEEFNDIGVLSKERLELGTKIAEIPGKFIISPSILKDRPLFENPIRRMNLDLNNEGNQFAILALFLVYIRLISPWNEDSFFHQFISTIPTEVHHPFINITDSQLMLHRHGSYSYIHFQVTEIKIRQQMEIIENIIENDENLLNLFNNSFYPIIGEVENENIWKQTLINIRSRSFVFGEEVTLLPFWDLFNHKSKNYHLDEVEKTIDKKTGDLSFVGSMNLEEKYVEEGEEIFLRYRVDSNGYLLSTYGIVMDEKDENPMDKFIVYLDHEKKLPVEMSYRNLVKSGIFTKYNKEIDEKMKYDLRWQISLLDSLDSVTDEERENIPVLEYLKFEKREIQKCIDLVSFEE